MQLSKQTLTQLAVLVLVSLIVSVSVYAALAPAAPAGELAILSTNQKITTNREGNTLNVLAGGKLSAAAGSTAVFSGDVQATVVRINSTPVFWPTPDISGGLYTVCGSTTITGTGTIAHGLATPSYVTYGMAGDATGDHVRISHTNSAATVTLKVWNSALTPAASSAGVAVDWCATGTR